MRTCILSAVAFALALGFAARGGDKEGEDAKLGDAIKLFYQEGMIDFTENLKQLVDRGDIDKATALEWAPDPEKLKMLFKGIKITGGGIL